MKKNKDYQQLKVVELNPASLSCENYEQFALVYSRTLQSFEDGSKTSFVPPIIVSEDDKRSRLGTIDRYVKICYNGKKVYRKCIAKAGYNSDEIGLSTRTRKELGVATIKGSSPVVCVKSTSFIDYFLFNSDKHIKYTAWIGLFGFIFTFVSSVISIISLFAPLPLFCNKPH